MGWTLNKTQEILMLIKIIISQIPTTALKNIISNIYKVKLLGKQAEAN